MDFTCNIRGANSTGVERFESEGGSCHGCGSTVRMRAIVYALSQKLFGTQMQLRDFPVLRGLRVLGLTDSECYA